MRTTLARWVIWIDSPGLDVALVVSAVLAVALDSFWPPLLWLACALGAAFDRGWRRRRRGEGIPSRR